jgi:hypothetical protein
VTDTGDALDYWFVDPFAAVLSATPEPSSAGLIAMGAALVVVGSLQRLRR